MVNVGSAHIPVKPNAFTYAVCIGGYLQTLSCILIFLHSACIYERLMCALTLTATRLLGSLIDDVCMCEVHHTNIHNMHTYTRHTYHTQHLTNAYVPTLHMLCTHSHTHVTLCTFTCISIYLHGRRYQHTRLRDSNTYKRTCQHISYTCIFMHSYA